MPSIFLPVRFLYSVVDNFKPFMSLILYSSHLQAGNPRLRYRNARTQQRHKSPTQTQDMCRLLRLSEPVHGGNQNNPTGAQVRTIAWQRWGRKEGPVSVLLPGLAIFPLLRW